MDFNILQKKRYFIKNIKVKSIFLFDLYTKFLFLKKEDIFPF